MFDDIRPYRDDEVVAVIERLAQDKEFISAIAIYTLNPLYKISPFIAQKLIQFSLKRKTKKVKTIDDVQKRIAPYLFKLIRKSTNGFSHQGLKTLDTSKPTLFISNHRDIVLDPALLNYAMFDVGLDTVEIAIGDNLLSKPWISDLMRLNKSFIVKRSEPSKRAMLVASKNLSAYIHHTLNVNHQHTWIAQREGRAKDGIDKTNPALISMLLLNKPKETSIADYLDQLNIVPVAISYEFDPCDRDKARELATIEKTGAYEKSEHEDIKSITKGLVEQKGKIHLAFGDPIQGEFQDSKAIAAEIDRQIINNYQLFDSNLTAFEILQGEKNVADNSHLIERTKGLTEQQKHWLLSMYANPVRAKKDLEKSVN